MPVAGLPPGAHMRCLNAPTEMPPLYRVGDTQAALCYLHRDASLGNVQSISDVFKSSI